MSVRPSRLDRFAIEHLRMRKWVYSRNVHGVHVLSSS
jgi:hypothetical protein